MLVRLKKASEISEANITPVFIDDELIQIEVQSGANTYLVSSYNDLFRCNCDDFVNRGVNREEGSFLCKHCLAVINYLMNNDPEMIELMIIENEDENTASKCPDCGNDLTEEYLGGCHGHVAKVIVCEHCKQTMGYF